MVLGANPPSLFWSHHMFHNVWKFWTVRFKVLISNEVITCKWQNKSFVFTQQTFQKPWLQSFLIASSSFFCIYCTVHVSIGPPFNVLSSYFHDFLNLVARRFHCLNLGKFHDTDPLMYAYHAHSWYVQRSNMFCL